ncbi:MAG: 23S rRNA (adenine(2503)-C(2))-methyltransferase RlmN [Candidatus Margulisbacteria bacterium]|nr:23S rRNA (adenine(2503)-C(2))-methyltransferase RlmN [Candidatus Margulisiibacteriota bacterium]
MKTDLRNLAFPDIEELLIKISEPKYRTQQIFQWIHQKGISSLEEMSNLSKELRHKLAGKHFINQLKALDIQEDTEGTKKYLWELNDGQRIESVLLDDEGRRTICLSTQVGCKMDCLFCATGKQKFKRNLTTGEIISQVLQIEKENGSISNLVYMGMGEPLDNYDNVLKSIKILNHPQGKNISMRKITISTCGLVPQIEKLAQEKLSINLAISLNASIDQVRSKIMPINQKYNLDKLLAALRNYIEATGRRVTFEYVLIEGKNDSRQDARGIVKLLRGVKANINLIAFNPFSGSNLHAPTNKAIKDFRWVLEDAGLEVTQRYKRGQNINAACGQLTGKYNFSHQDKKDLNEK